MILSFVFTAVAQSFLLDFWQTDFSCTLLYSRNVSENVFNKNCYIHLASPPNLALLFNHFDNKMGVDNKLGGKGLWFLCFCFYPKWLIHLYYFWNWCVFYKRKCSKMSRIPNGMFQLNVLFFIITARKK